jgi:hypothetical protein
LEKSKGKKPPRKPRSRRKYSTERNFTEVGLGGMDCISWLRTGNSELVNTVMNRQLPLDVEKFLSG